MKSFAKPGILPSVIIKDASLALSLADALQTADITSLEVDLTSPNALECIQTITSQRPDMIVGAGQVSTVSQCQAALASGAQFIFCSHYVDKMVFSFCIENKIEVIPCCNSISNIEEAISSGLNLIRIFPESLNQGLSLIQEYSHAFTGLQMIPSGSISSKDLGAYIASPSVCTVSNRYTCADADQIARIVRHGNRCRSFVMGFEFSHMGINCKNEESAFSLADTFHNIFSFSNLEKTNSVYSSPFIEIMKFKQLGTFGHIGIRSNSVERAVEFLTKKGLTPLPSTAKYLNGRLNTIYMEEELGGFAIHLIQRIL